MHPTKDGSPERSAQDLSSSSRRNRQIILYGACLAALLFLLKWLEIRLLIVNHSQEIFTGAVATIFTLLGIWLARKLSRPRIEKVTIEKEVLREAFVFDEAEAHRLGLTSREIDVLGLMAGGLSNQQISDKLFISLNTVKTHSKNLYEKLGVTRRTQAVFEGKKRNLIR